MTFAETFAAFARTAWPGGRLRLAPTPSGFLHPGNALNFTLNWLVARLAPAGRLLLRIDDLDAERKRSEYVRDIFESLEWLGLDWDEGPASPEDFEAKWSQNRRIDLYNKFLQQLREQGLLFACAKSRRDLAPFDGAYPPEFRNQNLSLDTPGVTWRIATPPGFPLPDFAVRRRDGLPAYQLASLADDLFFGITHVLRGDDLQASTKAQRFLAEGLGREDFLAIRFLHHPLLRDARGEKLSKSAGAESLKAWRGKGGSPAEAFGLAAGLLGLARRDFATPSDLLEGVRREIVLS